jgi:pimeloyl-ACP methyl ester carboxylesterase
MRKLRALPAFAAAVAAAALAVTGCTGPSPAEPANSTTLSWHSCPSQGPSARCASLQVPVNYADPGGRKITLALSEIPATAPAAQQQGVLLVNPGGPGGSGRSMASYVASGLSPAVASEYDIVGFDTRGVGSSVPALHCDPSFFSGDRPDYIPATASAEQVLEQRAQSYAADCEKNYSWLLPYMTTENIARDMDSMRAALGVPQISYFAFSYGTYIGQVYATLFPHHVRRMALDSVVDPTGVWWTDNIDQDYAFQGRQQAFFSWAAQHASAYQLGSTAAQVSASYYTARSRLAAHPVPGPSGPLIGPDELDDTFLIGGYDNSYWPRLADALSTYLHQGSSSQLLAIYQDVGTQNENEFAVYNAVECADANWPRSWAQWDSATRQVYATAPFEAWDNAWYNAACAFWPVKGPSQPLKINGTGLPPILMLQGTLDAATPYAGAQTAHRLLPSSRMVVAEGDGNHGQSLASPPNECVNGYLNRYLATGAVPSQPGQVNATCPAQPDPAPSS